MNDLEVVEVECVGITSGIGFNVYPEGGQPQYVEFQPGVARELPRWFADYLHKNDPGKFVIKTKAEPELTPTPEPEEEKAPEKGKKWFRR